ncbi:MAG: extracellular solute-binding protein [Spirochaetaceae bacterium]|jgi:putative aldouronate transport system substrate-binding protein|nr:extracellular solute-binding protein [Spirochaetaceae bacterium]
MQRFLLIALAGTWIFAGGCSARQSSSAGNQPGKPAEISVEVFDRGTDGGKSNPANNNFTAWIQEKLLKDENIAVTFTPVPRNAEIPALNNLMAAGNAPDICVTYTAAVIDAYRDQGGLYDVSPYADSPILKDLKAFLGPDPAAQGRDLIRRYEDRNTGKLYAIPAKRIDTAAGIAFIRKDWLDKLGLSIPETTQQFFDALTAFKEKIPESRTIPFAMLTFDMPAGGLIVDSFTDPGISDKDRWIYSNTMLIPGAKEGYRFLNKMYNAGLIDRDFPLYNNYADWFTVIKSGVVGSFIDLWYRPLDPSNRVLAGLKENVPGAELIAVDPFKNAEGVTRKTSYDVTGILSMIPAFSKNPESALRYLNWLSKYENMNFLQIGPEGITHDLVEGLPKVKPANGGWIMNSPNNMDYTIPVNGLYLDAAEKNARVLGFSYPDADPEWIINARSLAIKNALPPPFAPVTLTAGLPYVQTLADKMKTFIAAVVTAPAGNFDRVWDEGVADYLASGGQAIIDEKKAKWTD